jgi:TcpE family
MSFDDHGRVAIRSYRVVFRLERRIFQVDRFRLPFPYGVEMRALGYAFLAYVGVFLVSTLPLMGSLVGLLPVPVHWGLVPLGLTFAMAKVRIDGRPPHKVLGALVRWGVLPKHLAGLRTCPPAGFTFTPLRVLWMRPDWRAPTYRRALISGPATVTLRYPATVEVKRCLRDRIQRRRYSSARGEIAAKQLLVREEAPRPMFIGKTIHIPRGGRVMFR